MLLEAMLVGGSRKGYWAKDSKQGILIAGWMKWTIDGRVFGKMKQIEEETLTNLLKSGQLKSVGWTLGLQQTFSTSFALQADIPVHLSNRLMN